MNEREAEARQRELASRVVCEDRAGEPATVAGIDVIYADGRARAAAVLLRLPDLAVLDRAFAEEASAAPYVPGLFSFREAPTAIAALAHLCTRPDVILCDGHGRAHPRRFGLACHIGISTQTPTIGVAKSILCGSHGPLGEERGATAELRDRDEVIGVALRTQTGVKPVYVSVGHAISLATAAGLVLACAPRYRLPETTRLADRLSRA
jgi:deoxyribonuclease V